MTTEISNQNMFDIAEDAEDSYSKSPVVEGRPSTILEIPEIDHPKLIFDEDKNSFYYVSTAGDSEFDLTIDLKLSDDMPCYTPMEVK